MKRYKKYKPTDLSWAEKIPGHWQLLKIGQIFEQRKERNKPVKTNNILSLFANRGVLLYKDKDNVGNKAKEDLTQYNVCHAGDILINNMNLIIGSVGLSPYFGAISPVYYALYLRCGDENNIKYMEYIFRNYRFQKSLVGMGKGILEYRMRIAYGDLKMQYIPIPPLSEQKKIVAFLNDKISKIDRLIELKDEQIKKLKKFKIGVMADVIGGRIKVSINEGRLETGKRNDFTNVDIPWVKKIPVEWKMLKGKRILKLLSRKVRPDDAVITCFRDGEVTLRKNRRTEGFTNALKEFGYQGINSGDLVIHGMDGFAGAIGISDSRGKASPVLVVCDSSENKKYLMYYLRNLAYHDVFLALSTGIRVRSCDLRWNKIANMEFVLPPLDEQKRIADFLDFKIAEIDQAIKKTSDEINQYEALKQSLISEVVTGQIDVRDFEIPEEG